MRLIDVTQHTPSFHDRTCKSCIVLTSLRQATTELNWIFHICTPGYKLVYCNQNLVINRITELRGPVGSTVCCMGWILRKNQIIFFNTDIILPKIFWTHAEHLSAQSYGNISPCFLEILNKFQTFVKINFCVQYHYCVCLFMIFIHQLNS